MQLPLFERVPDPARLRLELFEAYYTCRRNKRNSRSALAFELNFESHILTLADHMVSGTFKPDPSIAFIVNKPVKREIFAASFRDRVVHHWLIAKINPLFEQYFVEDSYACRIGKGTLYGIQRVSKFLNDGLEQNKGDFYVLKLDIRGFFMHINRTILMQRLTRFLKERYHYDDLALVLDIASALIQHSPEKSCLIRGHPRDWLSLPRDKSLFSSPSGCGLPIGNLSSQVLANFYLHSLDSYIHKDLGIQCYGRYVDDFVLMDKDAGLLHASIPRIKGFLEQHLGLSLHHRKVYFQHGSKGLPFLGVTIKPGYLLLGNRTKGSFYGAITRFNRQIPLKKGHLSQSLCRTFQSSVNSYLGIMVHFNTYKLRRTMLEKVIDSEWKVSFTIRADFGALMLKSK